MHPRPDPTRDDTDDTMELYLGDAVDAEGAQRTPAAGGAGGGGSPVFVDTSGRRQRRVRRWGCLLVVPAVGYVALLVSALLGGPTVQAPFLPSARAPQTTAPHPTPTGGADSSAPSRGMSASSAPHRGPSSTPEATASRTSGATPSAAGSATSTRPTPDRTTGAATGRPTPATGKPTSRPGQGGGRHTSHP
ncbi:hypothetical protein ACFU3J_23485 [Streptomyces sp. NPDC057411]|uniref:hypothetical protein n=1 Tax=unclassified Streptomyces TaxID=2593676 RepID=UPI00362CE413